MMLPRCYLRDNLEYLWCLAFIAVVFLHATLPEITRQPDVRFGDVFFLLIEFLQVSGDFFFVC